MGSNSFEEVQTLLDYQKIQHLIYEDRSVEACTEALELLSHSQRGLDEAIRYRLMRNAYHRLKDKERVIECGQLSAKYADAYFRDRKILDEEVLDELCKIIEERLVYTGKYNIDIKIWIDVWISNKGAGLSICLKNSNGDVLEEIQSLKLKEELKQKIDCRMEEEWWLYYSAVCQEIRSAIKENVPDSLHKEVLCNISGSV